MIFIPSLLGEIFNEDSFEKAVNVAYKISLLTVNLMETDNAFKIQLAAPGLKKKISKSA